jgi:hypothetical protein
VIAVNLAFFRKNQHEYKCDCNEVPVCQKFIAETMNLLRDWGNFKSPLQRNKCYTWNIALYGAET